MKWNEEADKAPGDVITSYRAASILQEHLPESENYWALFLVNNRRKDRNPPHRIPYGRRHNVTQYLRSDIFAYIEFEKKRRLLGTELIGRAKQVFDAYGLSESTGSVHGRKLDYTLIAQEGNSGEYAQLIIKEPLLVFRLPPTQVEELAAAFSNIHQEFRKEKKHG